MFPRGYWTQSGRIRFTVCVAGGSVLVIHSFIWYSVQGNTQVIRDHYYCSHFNAKLITAIACILYVSITSWLRAKLDVWYIVWATSGQQCDEIPGLIKHFVSPEEILRETLTMADIVPLIPILSKIIIFIIQIIVSTVIIIVIIITNTIIVKSTSLRLLLTICSCRYCYCNIDLYIHYRHRCDYNLIKT